MVPPARRFTSTNRSTPHSVPLPPHEPFCVHDCIAIGALAVCWLCRQLPGAPAWPRQRERFAAVAPASRALSINSCSAILSSISLASISFGFDLFGVERLPELEQPFESRKSFAAGLLRNSKRTRPR